MSSYLSLSLLIFALLKDLKWPLVKYRICIFVSLNGFYTEVGGLSSTFYGENDTVRTHPVKSCFVLFVLLLYLGEGGFFR